MRLYKSPQVRVDDDRIKYVATGTTLSFNPIQKVERKNGTVEVTAINYIGQNATDEERFPHFQEV